MPHIVGSSKKPTQKKEAWVVLSAMRIRDLTVASLRSNTVLTVTVDMMYQVHGDFLYHTSLVFTV